MTATYRAKTPHRRDFPCPVCNGREDDPQHHGRRCYGFTLDDDVAFCTREEFSGALQQTAQGYYPHRLKGQCKCGNVHGAGIAVTPTGNVRARAVDSRPLVRPQEGEGRLGSLIAEGGAFAGLVEPAVDPQMAVEEHYFAMRDIEGRALAYHQRIDLAGGDKVLPWHPAFTGEETPAPSTLLFGLELLRDLPIGETVFLCEGEKAALALRRRGATALATVCGAKGTPVKEVLAYLRPFVTVLWPDNDVDGISHMRRIGERLTALGAHGVGWLHPPADAGAHFDAADFYADPDDDPDMIDEIVADHVRTMKPFKDVDFSTPTSDDPKVYAKKVRQRLEEIRPLVIQGLERADEHSLAGDIASCKTQFAPGKCGACGYEPANPIACKTPFCPICFGGRLLLDFKRKTERVGIPADLKHRMYRLMPVNPVSEEKRAFSIVGQRFTEARKRYKDLAAGITSLRWSQEHGAVLLLALPEGEKEIEGEYGPFKVEFLRVARGPEDIAFWLVDEGLDEIVEAFENADREMIWRYLSQIMGRRRFNGFGKWLAKTNESATEEARDPYLEGIEDSPISRGVESDYSKVSGGNNSHKKGELYPCPNCGEHAVAFSSYRINASQVVRHKTHWQVRRQ